MISNQKFIQTTLVSAVLILMLVSSASAIPGLTVKKTGNTNVDKATTVGQTITYTYNVTNTGNVDIQEPITINDNKIPGGQITVGSNGNLISPGNSTTGTATYTVTQTDLDMGSVTNLANATALFNGTSVTSPDVNLTIPAMQQTALNITKSVDPSHYSFVGQVITYNYTVNNTGNVAILGNINVTDDHLTSLLTIPNNRLEPSYNVTGQSTYAITQADLNVGNVINSANATTSDGIHSNQTTATINAIQTPALNISKSANLTTYSAVGQVIGYIYTVNNTGNVDLTGNITVADNRTGTFNITSSGLNVGKNVIGTANYTVTQQDLTAGSVTNSANSIVLFDNQLIKSPSTTYTVTAVQQSLPALTITKTPNPTSYTDGQSVTYTYLITNTGNVTLSNIGVVDNLAGPITNLNTTTLAPGQKAIGTGTYTTTQSDHDNGSVTNTATVYNGTTALNQTQATITAINKYPALSITKTPNPLTYSISGQTITYTYTVKNTGNVELNAVNVVDSMLGQITLLSTDLAPKAQTTGTATYQTKQADLSVGSVSNTATVYNGTQQLNQTTAKALAIQSPALNITKSANLTSYDHVGQVIGYTYTVNNTGNVDIPEPITVNDNKIPGGQIIIGSSGSVLASGTSIQGSGIYIVTQQDLTAGSVINSANATALFNNQLIKSPDTTYTVTAVQQSLPALTITKTPNPLTYTDGQSVAYTYFITNPGPVTVTDVSVIDNKLGTISLASITLLPGTQTIGTGTYTTTQRDYDNGSVVNTATVYNGSTALNQTQATITAINQNKALTITKTPNPTTYTDGQSVTYTYLITNIGNVTLSNIGVVDNLAGTITNLNATTLAPGQQATGTGNYVTTNSDYVNGSVVNTATVYNGIIALNQTTAKVIATQPSPNPALTITKTSNPLTYSASGQTITYTYTVKNTGNVELNAVNVVDSMLGQITLLSTDLAPNAQTIGTATYQTKQADLSAGSVINTATVYNDTQQLNQTTAKITATAPSWNPALTIVKSAYPTRYDDAGQTITYTYKVTNSGNADISAPITVTDDNFGTVPIQNSGILSPGSSVTGTTTYTTTQADITAGHVTNAAYTTGSFNSQPIISPSAIAIVSYEQPTKKEEHNEEVHNEEEHNGERDNYGRSGYGGYGGSIIPMIPGPMYGSPMYGNEPYGYGGEPYGPTETLNSESNVHKAKAHLSKHKHKNHSKNHTTKHHKTEKKTLNIKVDENS